jgi:rubredoxin
VIQINACPPFPRQKMRMEPELTILDDAEAPRCPNCGQPMHFVSAIPRFAALPELRTFECKPCGVTYTAEVTPRDISDVAWVEQSRHCGAA